jgi:hypothetical protein
MREGPQAALLLLWNLQLCAIHGMNKMTEYHLAALVSVGACDSVVFFGHRI